MNGEEAVHREEDFLPWLVASDKALESDVAVQNAYAGAEPPVELRVRLEEDLACIRLLRKVLPRRHQAHRHEAPLERLGRFEVRRELGRGSFGVVFLAWDPQLGREVALKVPRPEALLSLELRQRFIREARAAAGLDHPNLVPVFEVGEVGPVCYIASAYCPGITLTEWLRNHSQPVSLRDAASLVATLADAVQHAHGRGVIHRDLKPSNILLQQQSHDRSANAGSTLSETDTEIRPSAEPDFVPRITDFGLAKLIPETPGAVAAEDAAHTHSGAILGTPHYMAPEQASGKTKELGPAVDVYALGAILYELLTGGPPFRGETTLDTLEQVRSREPLPPSRLRPRLSRDLETICLQCLQKEPHKRYANSAALADDLRCYLAGAPIRARPIPAWERGIKWSRRRPALASLLAVSALAVTTVAGLILGYGTALARRNSALEQANADLKAAVTAKEEKRKEANDNLRLARLAIDDYATKVSTSKSLRAHDLEALRKELLQSAVSFYQKFLRQRPDDPDLQEEYAQAFQRLAWLTWEMGTKEESIQSFRQADTLLQQLIDEHPGEPRYQLERSEVLNGLAVVYKDARQPDLVEGFFKDARDIRHRLTVEYSGEAVYQAALAESFNNLAVVYEETGRAPQAEAALGDALEVWVKLCGAHRSVEAYQKGLAASQFNLGRVYAATSRRELAEQRFLDACKVWRELVRDHPTIPGHQDDLAKALTYLGIVYLETKRPNEALLAYEDAGNTYQKLAADHPKIPDYQASLARVYHSLGQTYARLGQQKQAEGAFSKAIDWRRQLASAYPENREYQFTLAGTLCNLGLVFCDTNRAKQASTPLNDARAIQEKLVHDCPAEIKYRVALGNTYSSLGLMAFQQGDLSAALEWLGQSVQMLEGVLKQESRHTNARHFLRGAYERRVDTLTVLGRFRDVLPDLDRLLHLAGGVKSDPWRFLRANALARIGQHALAMAEAEALAARPALPGETMYNLACVYSVCSAVVRQDDQLAKVEQASRSEQCAARAIEFLRKAQDAGFFKAPQRIEEMHKDKDLEPLRDRQDFQDFCRTLRPKGQRMGVP
jgi:serine/threonine protein kinase